MQQRSDSSKEAHSKAEREKGSMAEKEKGSKGKERAAAAPGTDEYFERMGEAIAKTVLFCFQKYGFEEPGKEKSTVESASSKVCVFVCHMQAACMPLVAFFERNAVVLFNVLCLWTTYVVFFVCHMQASCMPLVDFLSVMRLFCSTTSFACGLHTGAYRLEMEARSR